MDARRVLKEYAAHGIEASDLPHIAIELGIKPWTIMKSLKNLDQLNATAVETWFLGMTEEELGLVQRKKPRRTGMKMKLDKRQVLSSQSTITPIHLDV